MIDGSMKYTPVFHYQFVSSSRCLELNDTKLSSDVRAKERRSSHFMYVASTFTLVEIHSSLWYA